MNELKISYGKIRVHRNAIEMIHPSSKKKRQDLQDITIALKEIHHLELHKPRWPFSKGYIRFSLDGSHHRKKNSRFASRESFSMLCSTMKEYKKMKKIKCYIENQMKVDHERRKLPPNEVKQIEKLVEKIHHAKQDRKTGRLKRLVSKLESRGVEVKFQEEHISWQIKEQ